MPPLPFLLQEEAAQLREELQARLGVGAGGCLLLRAQAGWALAM